MSGDYQYNYSFEQDFDESSSRYTPLTHRQGSVGLGIYVAAPVPIPSRPVVHGEIREVICGKPSDETEEDTGSDGSWYTAEKQFDAFNSNSHTATKTSREAVASQPTRSTLDLLAGQGRYWKSQTIKNWISDVEIRLAWPSPELPDHIEGPQTYTGQEVSAVLDTGELALRLELFAYQVEVAKGLVSLLEAINEQIKMEKALVESLVLHSERLLLDELE